MSLKALALRELPRMLIGKTAGTVVRAVNGRIVAPLRDREWGAAVRLGLARAGRDPWVVVVVPDILHFVVPCIELAARHVPVVIVLNGVRAWEKTLLKTRFPELPTIAIGPVPGSMLPHGLVLDVLLRHADANFGLLDPDLYVFDPGLFSRLALGPGEVAAGAFGVRNRQANLTFPTTHLLALDVAAMQSLMRRHGLRASIYYKTPRRLAGPLGALNLGDHNFPKEHLRCYDPLNLLMAAALCDKLRLRALDVTEEQAVHFGGVTYGDESAHLEYLNAKMLALPCAAVFAERYRAAHIGSLPLAEARARVVAAGHGRVADWIDRTVVRIEANTLDGRRVREP